MLNAQIVRGKGFCIAEFKKFLRIFFYFLPVSVMTHHDYHCYFIRFYKGLRMRSVLFVIAVSILSGLALGGCGNTINGAGKDIERAGQNIQRNF